ncbi:ferritin-like domain-containing protein [Jeotgalibacillus soli]|uniref:Uncharacterized protein n=1 Tax=Jeotgalibacillus soli TaxID=889306 RepID=A0A0C2RV32_9BACL|nr:ferritin-like domain-containing protein [Jeotgalibacillus soli]KIL45584.1 hypothetical protein KP78_19330 [Jeotgalibacillus soli]
MPFIEELGKAIEDEYKAYYYYKDLRSRTNNPQFRKWIEHVMNDEKNHYSSFQALFFSLTGTYVQDPEKEPRASSFREGVLKSLNDEWEASEKYRDLLFQIPVQQAYQPLFVAMMDESEHAMRFSTILTSLQ